MGDPSFIERFRIEAEAAAMAKAEAEAARQKAAARARAHAEAWAKAQAAAEAAAAKQQAAAKAKADAEAAAAAGYFAITRTISSVFFSVMPAFSARKPAAWIEGPSAIGSVKGIPSSITSTPAAGRR